MSVLFVTFTTSFDSLRVRMTVLISGMTDTDTLRPEFENVTLKITVSMSKWQFGRVLSIFKFDCLSEVIKIPMVSKMFT